MFKTRTNTDIFKTFRVQVRSHKTPKITGGMPSLRLCSDGKFAVNIGYVNAFYTFFE